MVRLRPRTHGCFRVPLTCFPAIPPPKRAGQGSAKILQKFLGVRADGDHGRATDLALGAFLNTHHQEYPRVALKPYRAEMDRAPLIRKLQHFLNAHPLLTGAGATADTVVAENGVWDKPTVMALQTLLNRVTFADDFEAAAAAYKCTIALLALISHSHVTSSDSFFRTL
jgi:hypothetical protein